jgi:hypothetical protein
MKGGSVFLLSPNEMYFLQTYGPEAGLFKTTKSTLSLTLSLNLTIKTQNIQDAF